MALVGGSRARGGGALGRGGDGAPVSLARTLAHVARAYGSDPALLAVLAAALGGSAAVAAAHWRTPAVQQLHALMVPQKGAASKGGKASGGTAVVAKGAANAPPAAAAAAAAPAAKKKKKGAAVDAKFLKRLLFILRIVVPSWRSKEALLLGTQSAVLVARSLLTLRIAKRGGDGLQAVLERSWPKFAFCMADFFVSGVAASVVNSSLKYLTNSISLSFRHRLTEYVHKRYMRDRAFYKLAVLRVGGDLDNADQRIVEDLNEFCHTAADLFSRTFKPAIDVVLSTVRMADNMGYTGLGILYSYFVLSGGVVRAFSPPFPRYIAARQAIEGDFRRCHTRLITHAEEVAFLDGAPRELELLDEKLDEVTTYSNWYFLLQLKQGIIDQYTLKYFASMIGWPILAVPFLMADGPASESAARYRESDTLIQNASASIGDLMMVFKKIERLAGFTARVVELIEAVDEGSKDAKGGKLEIDDSSPHIRFDGVKIVSPDERLLVKDLSLEIRQGQNIIVTGANGAGKTSMFRVLSGLWRAVDGTVTRPTSEMNAAGDVSLFYVPQRPYLVSGTLRDQVTYPMCCGTEADEAVLECLKLVNLTKLVDSQSEGLNYAPHDWADILSGGEKQRIGLARLYFHKPKFAVLDEATSAINPDEEGMLYKQAIAQGTTVFSIAHRMELRKFHHIELNLHADGTGGYTLKSLS